VLLNLSHSDNSLIVGLDNGRGFFSDLGVPTLYSCVVIMFIFSSLTLLFANSGIKSFSSVRYHNSLYALWVHHCLIFHIRKKKCDIVKVLKKGWYCATAMSYSSAMKIDI
jgi:acetylglutamate synthase